MIINFLSENGCPRTNDPGGCGEICGWSTETNRCEADGVTTCEECPHICIEGSCFTFQESCPSDYNPRLVCQCTEDCAAHGNCCADESQCPLGIWNFVLPIVLKVFGWKPDKEKKIVFP